MVDILSKSSTLRKAVAEATVIAGSEETIQLLLEKKIPKGDVLECARVAGLFAVKRTSDMIPDCHPLPIEKTLVRYDINGLHIHIEVEVATIYKTGVEVEAMHGASVVALTIYDMLKPVDKNIEIHSIRLKSKEGGKSSYKNPDGYSIKTHVVVCSDTIAAGKKEDRAGKAIVEELMKKGITSISTTIIPDEKESILHEVESAKQSKCDLLIFCGGTGLSPRDITPQVINELIETDVPGIMEAARNYGQQRTPYAMLSRGIAGMIGPMLTITLPGSTRGAQESMQAIMPGLLHLFRVREGARHD